MVVLSDTLLEIIPLELPNQHHALWLNSQSPAGDFYADHTCGAEVKQSFASRSCVMVRPADRAPLCRKGEKRGTLHDSL